MSTEVNSLWFIVPAAGIGKRMGAECPKQYMSLGEKSIIEQTLSTLLQVDHVVGVVVALHPNDQYWPELSLAKHPKIYTIGGGQDRANSVLNALNFLNDKMDSNDWVLVHDAARPCVTTSSIHHLISTVENDQVGGILAVPASDTLKQVDSEGVIQKTIDRSIIWRAQTPQMFRYKVLRDSLNTALAQGYTITDEASAIEAVGWTAKVVEGRMDNIKVTLMEDVGMAQRILQQQNDN